MMSVGRVGEGVAVSAARPDIRISHGWTLLVDMADIYIGERIYGTGYHTLEVPIVLMPGPLSTFLAGQKSRSNESTRSTMPCSVRGHYERSSC